ncbi:MAG: hypothetical protein GWN58_25000, partial [Anaerolineae bacterium]|nr:hypothetical protein [Anaerolineae bacterium]
MTEVTTPKTVEGVSPHWGRWWRNFDRTSLIFLLVIAILMFLVINPLARLIIVSFQDSDSGVFTLLNYVKSYSRARYLEALGNSLTLG